MGEPSQWQPNGVQTIFLVFYAIFWGGIFGVQGRWKAFHWPLFCREPRQARYRTLLSLIVLNFTPIVFLVFAMWALNEPKLMRHSVLLLSWEYIRAVMAAFAIFGIYRIWLGIIELWPECFYASADEIPDKYRHLEPTFRHEGKSNKDEFVVYIGIDTGCPNVISGILYVFVSVGFLLIR